VRARAFAAKWDFSGFKVSLCNVNRVHRYAGLVGNKVTPAREATVAQSRERFATCLEPFGGVI